MFWIEGWIEVTRDSKAEEYEHSWQGVVRLLPLVDATDDVSAALFGLSKDAVEGSYPSDVEPLAANRGCPPNPSEEVRRDLQLIAEFEAVHGAGERGGYTFAEWSEIQGAAIPVPEDSDWRLVFDIAKRLAQRPGPTRVRFVAWYNW